MLLAQIADDGVVKVIAADGHAAGYHHLAHGQDGNVRHTRAHVHNHAAVGLFKLDAHPQRGGDGPVQQLGAAHARVEHDADDGALLNLVHAGGDGHHGTGAGEQAAAHHIADKVAQHGAGQLKIRHGALAQGTHRHHVARRAADHAVSVAANGQDLPGIPLNGHHRRLPEHNALALHVDQHIGRAQIDADVVYLCHDNPPSSSRFSLLT